MLRILGVLLVLFGGAAAGLASAKLALDRNLAPDLVRAGPWTARVSAAAVTADPYSRAERLRSASIPLASGEGAAFLARKDSDGDALDARCAYLVTGALPTARFWSVSLFGQDGRGVSNPAMRQGFVSTELSRDPAGAFAIAVAANVQTGDWLPAPVQGPFTLVLRLYDTPVSGSTAVAAAQMPSIRKRACP